MSYEYAEENRFEKPHTYMYTPFEGKSFLERYRESRMKCREALKERFQFTDYEGQEGVVRWCHSLTAIENDFEQLIHQPRFQAYPLFVSITAWLLQDKDFSEVVSLLDIFVKKFEVFKRLFTFYEGKTFRKIDSDDRNLFVYASFAIALVVACQQKQNWKYLNTLLKVNDLLCSVASEIDNHEQAFPVFLAISLELSFMETLIKEKVPV